MGAVLFPLPVIRGRAGVGVLRRWSVKTPTLTVPRSTGRGSNAPDSLPFSELRPRLRRGPLCRDAKREGDHLNKAAPMM
jgi:hypothetical protein